MVTPPFIASVYKSSSKWCGSRVVTTNPSVDAVTAATFPSSLLDIAEVVLARTPSRGRTSTLRRSFCIIKATVATPSHVKLWAWSSLEPCSPNNRSSLGRPTDYQTLASATWQEKSRTVTAWWWSKASSRKPYMDVDDVMSETHDLLQI